MVIQAESCPSHPYQLTRAETARPNTVDVTLGDILTWFALF